MLHCKIVKYCYASTFIHCYVLYGKISFYKLTVQESLDALNTSKDWLNTEDIIQRQKLYWKNILKIKNKESQIFKFIKQFKDALIILLIVSMFISIYLQDYRWATILWVIVLVNAIIWYIQEAKAEKIMQSLKKLLHPTTKVFRNWKLVEELVENLVPWDIIYLQEWDNIPADLRVIQESNLQTNDFSLTWESNPVNKFTHEISWSVQLWERNNIVFMWTTVATWEAYWLVISTWMETELWKIDNLSQTASVEATPLQNELSNIAKKLTIWTIILWWVLIVVALLADFTITEALIFAIWIAAAMVPQWLPAQVSVALTLASSRLAKQNALVKQLASVETLWCVNIICTDKTWTLTKNEMTVRNIYLWWKIYDVTWSWYENNWSIVTCHPDKIPVILNEVKDIRKNDLNYTLRSTQSDNNVTVSDEFVNTRKHFFYCCTLDSTARINPPDKDHLLRHALWDPTEAALITLTSKAWFNNDILQTSYPKLRDYWFDSSRKMMSTVRDIDGQKIVYVKWAAKRILNSCTQIFDWIQVRKITKRDKDKIMSHIDEFANQSMRNLTMAYKIIDPSIMSMNMQETESDLIFLWFVSILDPAREEVPAAIQAAYNAKIKVIMITWDHWLTAQAIAKKIWLVKDWEEILIIKWENLRQKTDIQLLNNLRNPYIIFSRTSPEDKLRIVSLLKQWHNIVAVTWDWVNDAPALKEANIWVSMWKIWTDVAKEASEIVLLDDSFSSLVNAIREWRIIYQNLKKTILSSITSNGWELFAVLMSLIAKAFGAIPIAINPVQILAVDLIWEVLPLTMVTNDPPMPWMMEARPRSVKNHLLNKKTIIDLIKSWAMMGIIAFTMYISYYLIHDLDPYFFDTNSIHYLAATSVTYLTIIFCQYVNILWRRVGIQSVFTPYTLTNRKLRLSFAVSIVFISLLLYNPIISKYFWFWPLLRYDRLLALFWAWLFLLYRENLKYQKRKKRKLNQKISS